MFGLGPATRIYVALGATDMRKGYDGLYGLVRDKLGLEVRTGHLFLFANARRNRLRYGVCDASVGKALFRISLNSIRFGSGPQIPGSFLVLDILSVRKAKRHILILCRRKKRLPDFT